MKISKRCIRIPVWIDKLALSSVKPNDYNPLCMIEVSRILTINGIFIMWMDLLTNTEVLRDTKIPIILTEQVNVFMEQDTFTIQVWKHRIYVCEIIKYNF